MKSAPVTMATKGLGESAVEIGMLYALSATGIALLFDIDWHWALMFAPIAMLGMLVVTVVTVHLLWLMLLGLERFGTFLGLRKSPLS